MKHKGRDRQAVHAQPPPRNVAQPPDQHLLGQLQPHFLARLTPRRRVQRRVAGLRSPAGQGHLARPRVVGMLGTLDKQRRKAPVPLFANHHRHGRIPRGRLRRPSIGDVGVEGAAHVLNALLTQQFFRVFQGHKSPSECPLQSGTQLTFFRRIPSSFHRAADSRRHKKRPCPPEKKGSTPRLPMVHCSDTPWPTVWSDSRGPPA